MIGKRSRSLNELNCRPDESYEYRQQRGRNVVKMRIAQVSPLYESCPPRLYGGTERVVSYLTEELVRQGHEVTLFASGDTRTAAKPRAPCAERLRLNPRFQKPLSAQLADLN